jgi:hypothetical protein
LIAGILQLARPDVRDPREHGRDEIEVQFIRRTPSLLHIFLEITKQVIVWTGARLSILANIRFLVTIESTVSSFHR